MLLQYFLIISPVYCVLDYLPDGWSIGGPRSPLERKDWRDAFEKGFRSFCHGKAENLNYEVSKELFNILERHANDGYKNTTLFRGFYYRVGLGYNPIYYLNYYPTAFAKYIARHTHQGDDETCRVERIFRQYPRFQCDTYSWGLSLYIYCIFVRKYP